MKVGWLDRRRGWLGGLALAAYMAGGLGPAGGALAAFLHEGRPARGACGCGEGATCCGAACCAPAAVTAAGGLPDCCADASEPEPAGAPALVAGCNCGHRDHQSSRAQALDSHLPILALTSLCPPPVADLAPGSPIQVAAWRLEPLDRVPKSSPPIA